MLIGIDASRAFIKNKTGIEEYSYRVILGLKDQIGNESVILYLRKGQQIDFEIPRNWKIKILKWPIFWTQIGLSIELLLHPVDALFVPAHTVPLIHPKKTVVVVHGLEYEICPQAYSFFERIYMRFVIKKSCQWASEIISVSENTKKDLINLYNVSVGKIKVIYEGYDSSAHNFQFPISNLQINSNDQISKLNTRYQIQDTKYILFIGRIEERKNIGNIIKAFEILKEKYKIPHKLLLAGKPGFGYEKVKRQMSNDKSSKDIFELGYISDDEKWELLKKAAVFVFPTLYEGFGIPILEAQSAGCPVVASNNSSIPEVAGESAILVDPKDPQNMADGIYKIVSNEALKDDIIRKGLENVKRFSWDKCAQEIASEILN